MKRKEAAERAYGILLEKWGKADEGCRAGTTFGGRMYLRGKKDAFELACALVEDVVHLPEDDIGTHTWEEEG